MNVRFGNLSVLAFEEKTEVHFSDEDFIWLNQHRADTADFKENDKFHIFELPLGIVAGEKCGPELVKRLSGYPFKRHFTVTTLQD